MDAMMKLASNRWLRAIALGVLLTAAVLLITFLST